MRSPFTTYAPLRVQRHQSPPHLPDCTHEVVTVSVGLLIWSLFAVFPHVEPFLPNLLIVLTLTAWWTPVWIFIVVGAAVLFLLLLATVCGVARPLRGSDTALASAALGISLGATIYVLLLNIRDDQEWVDGRLKLCVNHCGNPFNDCVNEPVPIFNSRTPAERATDAVAFFGANVFGAPMAVAARVVTLLLADSEYLLEVVYGTTGRDECTVLLNVPDANHTRPFVLVVDGLDAYSRSWVSGRYDWAGVDMPQRPPKTCGQGGLIANEAAAANAVATVLQEFTGRDVALYGCSLSGKVAAWAAATKAAPVYSHVLVDSGGTLGLASAREVGRCGEPFAAIVDRWPSWLAHNASRVSDVKSWPGHVDVIDTVLGACAAGTRFAASTSVFDQWNNGAGLEASVNAASAAGCAVDLRVATGRKHCGLF